jgi:hypothetical protein
MIRGYPNYIEHRNIEKNPFGYRKILKETSL